MASNKLKLIIALFVVGAFAYFLINDSFSMANVTDYSAWSRYLASDPAAQILTSTTTLNGSSSGVIGGEDGIANATDEEIAATINATRMEPQPTDLPQCPTTPSSLVGPIRVWLDYPSWADLEKLYPKLEPGGHAAPEDCIARHRVAIIIPYRDRDAHLRAFLHNMHALLGKQQLDYAIFIVEQRPGETFNRAKLMNVGFVEALALYDWQCFIFHDVDLLPEDDRNLYSCPDQPRHMSVAVDKFNYKLPYGTIFGGISALTKAMVEKINGFSNDYWGWGGEDDDLSTRVAVAGYKISRYPANIARYKMIKHKAESKNPINKCRYKLMYKTKQRWKVDGLSSLQYKRLKLEKLPLYTRILVDLQETASRAQLRKIVPSC